MAVLSRPLRVGDVLVGFCAGAFGRDSHDDKRVEAVGADWVVARDARGNLHFFRGDPDELAEYREGEQQRAEIDREPSWLRVLKHQVIRAKLRWRKASYDEASGCWLWGRGLWSRGEQLYLDEGGCVRASVPCSDARACVALYARWISEVDSSKKV